MVLGQSGRSRTGGAARARRSVPPCFHRVVAGDPGRRDRGAAVEPGAGALVPAGAGAAPGPVAAGGVRLGGAVLGARGDGRGDPAAVLAVAVLSRTRVSAAPGDPFGRFFVLA